MDKVRKFRRHLSYELRSPLRVGRRKVGNLQTTRLYVPGLAVWASTVNRLVSLLPDPAPGKNPYHAWGVFLRKTCRFSSLFILNRENNRLLLPGREQDRQILEDRLLFSSVHTPIFHDRYVKEDGMLHELEWLHPVPAAGLWNKVIFRGWLDIDVNSYAGDDTPRWTVEDNGEPALAASGKSLSLSRLMAQVTAGADLNKGCGRLVLLDGEMQGSDNSVPDGGDEQYENGIPGPLLPAPGIDVTGSMETVAGRCSLPLPLENGEGEEKEYRPGGYLYHYLAYLPGAKLDDAANYKLEMDWQGCFRLFSDQHADPGKG